MIELAKRQLPELEKLNMDLVFKHIYDKSVQVETRLVEKLEKELKFEENKVLPVFEFSHTSNKIVEEQQPE